ncbi:MAG: hypothetical protein ACI4PF_05595 [Christensenellales bacterium]
MKNKTKKILAGLGLGLVGAVTLTGCTSDITFNQADLDKVISEVTEYLETQNNYSSEFASNVLNNMLIQTKFDLARTKGLTCESDTSILDVFGNVTRNVVTNLRMFYDDKTKTNKGWSWLEENESKTYYEIAYNSDTKEYNITNYDLTNRTYTSKTQTNDILENNFLVEYYFENFVDRIISIVYGENQDCMVGNVTMEKVGDNHYRFKFIYAYERELNYEEYGYYSCLDTEEWCLEFENNKLSKIEGLGTINYDDRSVTSQFGNMNILWDTGDFTVDTSECTEVPAGE